MTFNLDNATAIQEPKQVDGFVESPSHKRIGVRAFIGTFGTSIFIQGCTIIQGILIARLLGPVGRGEYAAVILWPSLFAAIGIFGSNIALARTAAKESDSGEIIRTGLVLGFLTSAFASLACYVALPYLMPASQEHILSIARLFVLFVPLNHLGLNLIAIDHGCGHFRNFNLTRSILYPVYIAMILGLWFLGKSNVKSLAIALLTANLAVVIIRLTLALRKYPLLGKIYSLQKTIKSSLHFGLAGMAMPVYLQADKALILWLLDAENLGFYTVALSASAVIGSVTGSMGMVSFTMSAQADKGEGFERIAKTFRISVVLWIVFGTTLAILMQVLLPFVYGADFALAVNSARLLIVSSAFAGLANLLEQSMRGQGKAFVGLEGRVAGLIVMSVTGLLLVPSLVLIGVCLAYILCQLTCLSVIIWRTNQHYSVRGLSDYVPRWTDAVNLIQRFSSKITFLSKRENV